MFSWLLRFLGASEEGSGRHIIEGSRNYRVDTAIAGYGWAKKTNRLE
jgi:hypothetical protein